MSWSSFYADGGWGMHPTTLFGAALLLASVVYALRPEARFHRLLLCLGILTIASGVLGFTIGLITTLRAVVHSAAPPEQLPMLMTGVAESAHNVMLALIAVILAALTAGVGALRVALKRDRGAQPTESMATNAR